MKKAKSFHAEKLEDLPVFTTGGKTEHLATHLDAFARLLKAEFGSIINEVVHGRPRQELPFKMPPPVRVATVDDLDHDQRARARAALATVGLSLEGDGDDDEDHCRC